MRATILTTHDADAWNSYLARLPGADIYHTPEYHRAHEANGDGTALCFVAEDGGNLLLHPFMLRDIPSTDRRDIETVYGYSGPLSNMVFRTQYERAWWRFCEWTVGEPIVAEFCRFNPLSGNWGCWLAGHVLDRETVVLDLSGTPADLWDGYTPTARNKVRKAGKAGIRVAAIAEQDTAELLPEFVRLYQMTMERNGAEDYYRFTEPYWRSLMGLGGHVRLLLACDGDVTGGARLVTASLFLLYRDRMHYHLTGSDADYRDSGAGNLLIHYAACWGIEHGYRYLHLGGGRTPDPHDSLFRFKASISRERRPFYVGKRIHNQAAYDELCAAWEARTGRPRGNYFLAWRQK